jgi:hypothetical protein
MSKTKKRTLTAYMDYDKYIGIFHETIYFKRPITRHTNPDVIVKKVKVIY